MNGSAAAVGALLGSAAGVAAWRWLRAGRYRSDADEPRLRLRWSWLVVPAAGAAGAAAGAGGWRALAPAAWLYLVGGVVLAWIDLDVHRVPNRMLRWWAPLVAGAIAAGAGVAGEWGTARRAALGAMALGGLFLVLALVGSMGLGDVKLAAATGLLLGAYSWAALLTGVAVAFGVGAAAGVVLLARGVGRTTHLAFGPAIIVGGAAAVLRVAAGL